MSAEHRRAAVANCPRLRERKSAITSSPGLEIERLERQQQRVGAAGAGVLAAGARADKAGELRLELADRDHDDLPPLDDDGRLLRRHPP